MIAAEPERAALVLLDANMGGGERDGLQTLRRIVQFYQALWLRV